MRMALLGIFAGACLAQELAFDAASVKLADPAHPSAGNSGGPGTSDPGRIHRGMLPMIALLTEAYDIQIDRVAGPAWISDFSGQNRYMIDATIPPETTKAQFQAMLQNLLVQRFQLAVHRETRNFPGYDLVVAKDGPKLKESVPSEPPPADVTPAFALLQKPAFDKDGSIVLPPGPRMMSMTGPGVHRLKAQQQPISVLVRDLSDAIPEALGADLMAEPGTPRARVADKTGLTGKYDFTLEFACAGCQGLGAMAAWLPAIAAARAQAQADAPPASVASEPAGSGLPAIFAALEKQLGLKLEKTKDVPLEVIVVDHVDKVPTAN